MGQISLLAVLKTRDMIAKTPSPPYYAVVFSSIRTEGDKGYSKMSDRMIDLAKKQDGFLGAENARHELGITISYWKDLNAIKKWREHAEHAIARQKGRNVWYRRFKVRIAKVERDYEFQKE